jgi:hypothetical protein
VIARLYHRDVDVRARRRVLIAIVLLGLAVAAIVVARRPLLRSVGWILVWDEPMEPADAIVIATDADGAGVLETADLVHARISSRIAVFADPPGVVDLEFIRRGVAYEDRGNRETQQLRSLGIAVAEQIDVEGTQDEGRVLPEWCDRESFRTIVVVTSADHSRRLRRVLDRAMKGHKARVIVRRSRYSEFDPDRWWQTRMGTRAGLIELEKLLVDVVRHPFS